MHYFSFFLNLLATISTHNINLTSTLTVVLIQIDQKVRPWERSTERTNSCISAHKMHPLHFWRFDDSIRLHITLQYSSYHPTAPFHKQWDQFRQMLTTSPKCNLNFLPQDLKRLSRPYIVRTQLLPYLIRIKKRTFANYTTETPLSSPSTIITIHLTFFVAP